MVNDAILNFVINKINLLLKFGTKIGMMSNDDMDGSLDTWIFRFLPFALI